jgi:hypothetical protein
MVVIDNDWKLISMPKGDGHKLELYNLVKDKAEERNLFSSNPAKARALREKIVEGRKSIDASVEGLDYPGGKLNPQPPRIFWTEIEAYKPHFKKWKKRPEYESRLRKF